MQNLAALLIVLMVLGIWVCGNAAWILALANLVWLLFKGHTLVSWWWPAGAALYAVLAMGTVLWLKLTD